MNAFSAYVGQSRHRRASFLVTSDGAERQEITTRRPIGDPRPVTQKDVIANMARNLSRQPEKASALALLDTQEATAKEHGTMGTDTIRDSAYLNRLRERTEELHREGQKAAPTTPQPAQQPQQSNGQDATYVASLYSREQQLPKEQREAEEAEQNRAKRQRRGMRM